MKRIITTMLLLTALYQANAQKASGGGMQTTNLALSNAIELKFVNGSGGLLSMPFTSLNDLVNGVESATQELRVRSNKSFGISAIVSSSTFTYTGTSLTNNILPVSSVLKMTCIQASGTSNQQSGGSMLGGLTGGLTNTLGSWLNMSATSPTTIISNCAAGANQTFTVKYKTIPGINAAPGSYSTSVIFTATQQ